jgi:hypothetical protein
LTAAPRSRKKAIRSRRKSTPRSTGVIGRAIKRGISELAKVGT